MEAGTTAKRVPASGYMHMTSATIDNLPGANARRLCRQLAGNPHVKVLFVCLGNICRSPAAHGVFQSIVDNAGDSARWNIDSAGTGAYHTGELPDKRMRVHAQRRGYTLSHRARQVCEADFDRFDIIVAMDASNAANLRRLAPTAEQESKIVGMMEFCTLATRYDHVPDPYYEGSEGFELVLDLLENACANLHTALQPK